MITRQMLTRQMLTTSWGEPERVELHRIVFVYGRKISYMYFVDGER